MPPEQAQHEHHEFKGARKTRENQIIIRSMNQAVRLGAFHHNPPRAFQNLRLRIQFRVEEVSLILTALSPEP
jgi:hypothetical protein